MLTRLIRDAGWRSLVVPLLVVGGAAPVWAQNTFPASGNVGIGTLSPDRSLSVVAPADAIVQLSRATQSSYGTVEFRTGAGQNWLLGTAPGANDLRVYGFGVARDVLSISGQTGNIGIGTTGPDRTLTIVSPSDSIIQVTRGTTSTYGVLELKTGGSADWLIGTHPGSGDLRLWSFAAGGYVLSVAAATGDVTVTGNIAAKYQDIAEWVRTRTVLAPGTVVVIDRAERNGVRPSEQPYDPGVAGVVSARPGLLLGEASADAARVAHSGRVKVRVDAAYGAIAVGDLLVTSPTPGHAMRSEPVAVGDTKLHRPGTIVGKALEPMEGGRGEILVLLTLQ